MLTEITDQCRMIGAPRYFRPTTGVEELFAEGAFLACRILGRMLCYFAWNLVMYDWGRVAHNSLCQQGNFFVFFGHES